VSITTKVVSLIPAKPLANLQPLILAAKEAQKGH